MCGYFEGFLGLGLL